VLLAYGMTFPDRTILFNFFIPMRARTFIILLIGMQVLFFHSYMASGIAVVAHLGGMLFGYLYLKKVWRVRALAGEIRWRLRRRRFRVVGRKEHERFPFN
jgi:rhomboid-like protein